MQRGAVVLQFGITKNQPTHHISVDAEIFNEQLAIHQKVKVYVDGGLEYLQVWQLTHRPTGFSISGNRGLPTRAQAYEFAKFFVGWTNGVLVRGTHDDVVKAFAQEDPKLGTKISEYITNAWRLAESPAEGAA